MAKKNVLLLCGGGGSEHEISLVSAKYILECLKKNSNFDVSYVEINKQLVWVDENQNVVELKWDKKLYSKNNPEKKIDIVIPCIHGYPGETGDIQSFLDVIGIPYIGPNSESSKICFNKLTTKIWLDKIQVPNTPYLFLIKPGMTDEIRNFFNQYKTVYIKATNQGSSVGVYKVNDLTTLEKNINEAFTLSPYVIIEKALMGRELEISIFEYQNKIHVTNPGEIHCPTQFYSYEEKYAANSKTSTSILAMNLPESAISKIKEYSERAFKALKLKDLSRMDFFYTNDGEVLLNEINTFPGLTPISMFPKMMENYGVKFVDYLNDRINESLKK
ncbi:MAG: D-alanine--D-alanine ligase [Bacteriovoracaceae bacterium]